MDINVLKTTLGLVVIAFAVPLYTRGKQSWGVFLIAFGSAFLGAGISGFLAQ